MRLSGRSSRTGFQRFALSEDDLRRLLAGQRPGLEGGSEDFFPTLTDRPVTEGLQPLPRMACKMATGAGKTVVMAMLIAWAFCNRGRNLGVDHIYEPDFLVKLTTGATVVLEIKGFEEHEDRAKCEAAKKWVRAVNNWGQLGRWHFHVCRDPQVLERELGAVAAA